MENKNPGERGRNSGPPGKHRRENDTGEWVSCDERVDRGAWIDAWAVGNGRIGNDVSASNEIKAVPKLLDILEVKGDVITADAMSCQTEIAKKIREKEADYILAGMRESEDAI